MTIGTLTSFFGWCTVINLFFLVASTLALIAWRKPALRIHANLFGLSEEQLSQAYFQYFAQYKIAAIIFSLVPYLALKLITWTAS